MLNQFFDFVDALLHKSEKGLDTNQKQGLVTFARNNFGERIARRMEAQFDAVDDGWFMDRPLNRREIVA